MKSHQSTKMENVQNSEHRSLFVVYIIVSALVFYAMYLMWQDDSVDTSDSVAAAFATPTQITSDEYAEPARVSVAGLGTAADLHDNAMSQAQDQQVAVNFLLHQLQTSAQGVAVVGSSQQGLANNLGLRDGDQITEINGQAVHSVDEVQGLLLDYHPKQTLHFKGKRDGQTMSWTYQAQADD